MATNDPIQILKQDHQRVRALFDEIERGERQAAEVLEELALEIENHTTLEEELFYPAFQQAVEGQEIEWRYFASLEEHALVDQLLEEAQQDEGGSVQLTARCRVMRDLTLHHLDEEERELFPLVQKVMKRDQMDELGEQMARRHAQLLGEEPEEVEELEAGAEGAVDLNSASAEELAAVLGIDEARAEKLVQHREENGPFESWDEVLEVEGIGSATLSRLREEGRIGG